MTINLLPQEIINQIAAGEVIENPAAVIKELVENSIDAGADTIEVDIKDSGLKQIIIKDNGSGISKEDLILAPKRHATSKIKTFSDLYNIKTMGFRGEALASIFSVANSKIITNKKGEAYEISSKNLTKIKQSAAPQGTTIIVEDLFYNTPARKKYLKSNTQELRSIVEVINRYCTYHYNIKFTLKHNQKTLINKPVFKTQQDNLYYLLGKDLRGKLIEFQAETQGIKVNGFIGKPSEITYPYIKNQFLYVNERYVKSKLIRDAIYEGFTTNLMSQRHPLYFVSIEIDPEIIDVNVHPTKIEIRFENELEIFEFIKQSIKNVFEKTDTIKPFEEKKERNIALNEISNEITAPPKQYPKPQEEKESSYFAPDKQKHFEVQDEAIQYQKSTQTIPTPNPKSYEPISEKEFGPLGQVLENYRVVGLINKTYIIIETKNEMFLLDFHAAAEKIKYEKLIETYENKTTKTQKLLQPTIIALDKEEQYTYIENKNLLETLGFKSEKFGNQEIIIREVPLGFSGEGSNPNLLKEILHSITIDKKFKGNEIEKVEKLARAACRSSIKAGYEMTLPEIKKLIEELKFAKEPFNCPHGRPTMLRFTWTDLEKRFKRIV